PHAGGCALYRVCDLRTQVHHQESLNLSLVCFRDPDPTRLPALMLQRPGGEESSLAERLRKSGADVAKGVRDCGPDSRDEDECSNEDQRQEDAVLDGCLARLFAQLPGPPENCQLPEHETLTH